jgi:hypothetical protein
VFGLYEHNHRPGPTTRQLTLCQPSSSAESMM